MTGVKLEVKVYGYVLLNTKIIHILEDQLKHIALVLILRDIGDISPVRKCTAHRTFPL